MKFTIRSRWDGSVLFETDAESIAQAMELAVKQGARLVGARLNGASLVGARLVGASLDGASLDGARLNGASLVGARLDGASGIDFRLTTPLAWLFDQPGPIRSYKLVTKDGVGPFNRGLTYAVGEEVSVDDFNSDPAEDCGAGINLGTLDWCLRHYEPSYRILIAEHTADDIVCVPIAGGGKYRVKRCRIVGEKPEWWIRSALPWLDGGGE